MTGETRMAALARKRRLLDRLMEQARHDGPFDEVRRRRFKSYIEGELPGLHCDWENELDGALTLHVYFPRHLVDGLELPDSAA